MINENEITNLYKAAFPQTEHEADSGYILRDGTVIDISSKGGMLYCHGLEFQTEPLLSEWKETHRKELPFRGRETADEVANGIGAIEFTVDNMRLRCVRLPNKPLTAAQKQPLAEIIGRILERGSVKVEVLGTDRFAEYDPESNGVQDIMRKIERL